MKKFLLLVTAVILAASVLLCTGVTAVILFGDAYEDGVIDNKDVVYLFRYVSGSTENVCAKNCDYNNDGTVNNKDVAALFRALSGTGEIPYVTKEEPGEFTVIPDSSASLSVSHVFGSYMVIQRDAEIKVWGTSNKNGAKIRATFMGEEARGVVSNGKWEITFSPKSATRSAQDLVIEDSCGNKIEFNEILVGDVWLINGQSNAEQPNTDAFELMMKVVDNPGKPLRLFQEGALYVIQNTAVGSSPSEDTVNQDEWYWRKANRYGAFTASALGWHFGNTLVDKTGIPIGIVSIAASGATITELMPAELNASLGYTNSNVYTNVGISTFYNALTHPFLKMKFTGMIYFQGESETGSDTSAANYKRDFEAYMTELRSRWGFDFPIYNVQLCDYTSKAETEYGWSNVGYIRAQQYSAYTEMTGIRLVPSYDLGADEGYGNYAHSPYKEELADRVAKLALADIYGIGTADEALAPEPVSVTVVNSSSSSRTINVKFKNVGDGLTTTNNSTTVKGFTYGRNASPKSCTAVSATIISNDTVQMTVSRNYVSTYCKYIGYACKNNVPKTDAKLINSYGIPALAFWLPI